MADLNAKSSVTWQFGMTGKGADGYEKDFGLMDDSFKSWLAILQWNWHYRHWSDLRKNVRDLFTRVIWRKLWRHS